MGRRQLAPRSVRLPPSTGRISQLLVQRQPLSSGACLFIVHEEVFVLVLAGDKEGAFVEPLHL